MKYTETDLELATLDWLEELGYSIVGGPDIAPPPDGEKPERKSYSGGPDIAPPPDGEKPERKSYSDVVLEDRLRSAINQFNPKIPEDAREEAFKKVVQVANATPSLVMNNKLFHSMLRDGVDVEYMRKDGSVAGDKDAKEEAFKKVVQVANATPSLVMNNKLFHSMLRDGVDVEYMRKDGSVAGDKVRLADFGKPENNDWLAVNQYTVIENNIGWQLINIQLLKTIPTEGRMWLFLSMAYL